MAPRSRFGRVLSLPLEPGAEASYLLDLRVSGWTIDSYTSVAQKKKKKRKSMEEIPFGRFKQFED